MCAEHRGTVYTDGRCFVKVATHSDPGKRGPRASSPDSLPPPTGDGPWSRGHAPSPEPTPLPRFLGFWACSQVDTQLPLCTPGLSVKGTAGTAHMQAGWGVPMGGTPCSGTELGVGAEGAGSGPGGHILALSSWETKSPEANHSSRML